MEATTATKKRVFDPRESWHHFVNPDLNGFGRIFAYMRWYLDNVRISIVGRLVTAMLLLILGVMIYSSFTSAMHIREVKDFWNHFDVGTSSVYDLGRKLENKAGSQNLFTDIARMVANPGNEEIQTVKNRIAETRSLVASIRQAGPTEEEAQALTNISNYIDRISAGVPTSAATAQQSRLLALQRQAFSECNSITEPLRILTANLSDDLAQGGRRVGEVLDTMARSTMTEIAVNGVLLILLAIFFFWFSGTRLSRPLHAIQGTMNDLAAGQKSVNIPYLKKADEIGEMSRSVAVFKENALQLDNMMDEQKTKADKERMKARKMMELTDAFEGDIEGVVKSVAGAAENLAGLSKELMEHVREQEASTETAAEASEGSVEKAAMVSAAATELSSSINEIAQRIGDSMQVASEAAKEAKVAQKVMAELSEASSRIEQVTELINEIAERINLLALNATIEAQRAGEAGKGFAVVAGEVKNLSVQTGEATSEVTEQVEMIKKISTEAGTSIERVTDVIEKINLYSTEISSAITEQQSSTEEISRSIDLLAQEADTVKGVIEKVVTTSQQTGEASNKLNEASRTLSSNSSDLAEQVTYFLKNIRE